MIESIHDIHKRVLATLSSLMNNVNNKTGLIGEIFVTEFHTALDKEEAIGVDVTEFRIPDSNISPEVTSISTLTFNNRPSGPTYSNEKGSFSDCVGKID